MYPTGNGESRQGYVMPSLYTVDINTIGGLNGSEQQSATRQMYLQYAPNSTFATVQHVPIALTLYSASLDLTWALSDDRPGSTIASIEMAQPVTSVLCNLNSISDEADTRPIQFPDTYTAGCAGDPNCESADQFSPMTVEWGTTNYTGISRSEIWKQAQQDHEGRIIWLDDIQIKSPVAGSALGAIIVQSDFCDSTTSNKTYLTVSACVIGGIWSNITSSLQSDSNGQVTQNVPRSAIETTTLAYEAIWSRTPVNLTKNWAESLNTVTNIQNRTVADNLLRWMPVTENICPINGTWAADGTYPINAPNSSFVFLEKRPFMHEALLASLVANGMSHAADGIQSWTWDSRTSLWDFSVPNYHESANALKPPGIVLHVHGHLLGYAYNLDGFPIKIALPILMLYLLYTTPYVLFTLITGRSSRIWGTMSGFTALAINSTPTKALKHTSAGISQTNTFRHMVSVREVEANDQLELTFEKDEDKGGAYKRVVLGRGY
jgi:hypothetical protein